MSCPLFREMAILPLFRCQGETRNEGRREQFHFRKTPTEYLAALEEHLCQQTMQS